MNRILHMVQNIYSLWKCVCDENVGSLQLEQWCSMSSVTQSIVPSQERFNHNTPADSDLQMYAARELGE